MATHTWTLTDTTQALDCDTFEISAREIPGTGDRWSVVKQTLHGGLCEGVDTVEINNGRMQLVILPTRGMGVWQARIDDGVLGWRSPVRGPVHPAFVPIFDPSGLGWLEGFDELVVRCGLGSNGAPDFDASGRLSYPLHGRIANRPAWKVDVIIDDSSGTLTVRGVVDESRIHFQKLRLVTAITTSLDSTSFAWHDTVENIGGKAAEMQMLYHINVGEPILTPGSKLVAPVASMAPRDSVAMEGVASWNILGPPEPNSIEQVFFFQLAANNDGQTQVLLMNPRKETGTAVRFNVRELPYFTLWKNQVAKADGYVIGIEPATNFPNPRSFESQQNRVIQLAAGATWSADVEIDWLLDSAKVAQLEGAIQSIQGATQPAIHHKPQAGWSQ
ncbi:MAG: aldose 1-epimerase family protein [Pirellulales bacterium]|nr:aldose 1-epimerase family protein [Pirellulales bacterium]